MTLSQSITKSPSEYVAWLDSWYQTKVSLILRELDGTRDEEFRDRLEKLKRRAKTVDSPATVCVIGRSGIGKSTLINAVVGGARQVVPAGGVGPLTAHALVIRYGDRRRLTVRYHRPNKLWQLIFALGKLFPTELQHLQTDALSADSDAEESPAPSSRQSQGVPEQTSEFPVELDDPNEEVEVKDGQGSTDESSRRSRATSYRAVAQLLVTGSQTHEQPVEYLAAALREALKPVETTESVVSHEHRANIDALRAALELSKSQAPLQISEDNPAEFESQLKRHASGNLSPIVAEFSLDWPSDLLRTGIEFVDLPGTGIAGDSYQNRAREWMTQHARAVMVVVDHRGVDESVAAILHRTNFLNSLLYYSDDMPEGRPVLIAAVTKLDDIARSARANADPSDRMPIAHYFREASDSAIEIVRSGIKQRLLETTNPRGAQGEDGSLVSEAMNRAIDELVGSLEVHAVSAPDFRDLISEDPDATPTLKRIEDTNIPELKASLHRFASRYCDGNRQQLTIAARNLHNHVMSELRVHLERWTSDVRADEAARQLEEKLRGFLKPLNAEFHRRQGRMKEFLDSTMRKEISSLVDRASEQSGANMLSYLRRNLAHAHWGTLKAAVRRGGRYRGTTTDVDLPDELTKRFEEPIADLWGRSILEPIRKEIRVYAEWCAQVVEQIADWSKAHGAHVKPALVKAQAEAIKADAKNLANVGAEMVRELRDDVKGRLSEAIERSVREACSEFVSRELHVGLGTKRRILDLFDELSAEVRMSAKPTALRTLNNGYNKVRKEIDAALRSTDDPISRAADVIVESQESFTRRQDAQRRRRVVSCVEEALHAAPAFDDPSSADSKADPG